jgi:hypothetical protein
LKLIGLAVGNTKCNHCPNDSNRLQNRDNKHVKCLADPKQCPNAPAEVRKQALIYLAGKNASDTIFVSASHTMTPAEMGNDAMSTVDATTALVPVKKRKLGTLAGMVDYPLSEVRKLGLMLNCFGELIQSCIYDACTHHGRNASKLY